MTLILRATDLIKDTKPIYAHPSETVETAIKRMASHNIGSIPVVNEDMKIVGIITERDIVRLLASKGPTILQEKLENVMTRKLITANPEDPISALAYKMIEHGIRHLPVVDQEGKLLGVISIRKVLRHLIAGLEHP